MAEVNSEPQEKQVYISLWVRYLGSFCLMFLVLLGLLYLWIYNFGLPIILERATMAFDTSVAVSSVTLDPAAAGVLRGNFLRALEIQVWENLSRAGLSIFGVLFLASVVAIGLSVVFAQRHILHLTEAARQIAAGKFDVDLSHVYGGRTSSEVAELARAIEASGRAHLREQKLKVEVAELRIEIDHLKRDSEVHAIVETDSFQELRRKAAELRRESAEDDQ